MRVLHKLYILLLCGENYLGKRCFPLFPHGSMVCVATYPRINTFSAHPRGVLFLIEVAL